MAHKMEDTSKSFNLTVSLCESSVKLKQNKTFLVESGKEDESIGLSLMRTGPCRSLQIDRGEGDGQQEKPRQY